MHQSACRVVNKRQQRALLCAVLKPGVFRSVDLHQLAQAIAPAARLMRGGKTMEAVDPPTRGDHPPPQRLPGDPAAVLLRQLLPRQRLTEISVSFANQRQSQITIRLGQTIVARPTAPFRNQAGCAPCFKPASNRNTCRRFRPSSSQASTIRRRPDRTPSRTSSRLNSFLLIDTTGIAHPRSSSNPGQCHVNFAERCHLYIAATGRSLITSLMENVG